MEDRMTPHSPNHAGLVFGSLLAAWHLIWAILVAAGWAQPLIDFIFRIHFLKPAYTVEAFELRLAVMLIVITFGVGYVIGAALIGLWNTCISVSRT